MNRLFYFVTCSVAAILAFCATSCEKEVVEGEPQGLVFFDEKYFLESTDSVVTGKADGLTPYGATFSARFGSVLSVSKLKGTWSWGVVVSQDTCPMVGATGSIVVQSKSRTGVFSCSTANLLPDTRYYYKAYLRENNKIIHYGKAMQIVTPACKVSSSPAQNVLSFNANIGGVSNVNLNDKNFPGEVGVLYTKRPTDRPNIDVDPIALCSRVSMMDSLSFEVRLTKLDPNAKYLYQSYVKIGDKYYWGDVRSFTTMPLSISEEAAIDLGLTVLWASHNVGATRSYETGTFFGYGEPSGTVFTKKLQDYSGEKEISGKSCDMATVNMGVGYQLPSFEQMRELVTECDWRWMAIHDVQGYVVTGPSGQSIFLPAVGYTLDGVSIMGANVSVPVGFYWTGSRYIVPDYSYCIKISQAETPKVDHEYRYYGMNVRPVVAQ